VKPKAKKLRRVWHSSGHLEEVSKRKSLERKGLWKGVDQEPLQNMVVSSFPFGIPRKFKIKNQNQKSESKIKIKNQNQKSESKNQKRELPDWGCCVGGRGRVKW